MHEEFSLRAKLWKYRILRSLIFDKSQRITSLKLGNQNSSYFHRSVKVRTSKNTTSVLYSADGTRIEGQYQIPNEAISFNKGLLGTLDSVVPVLTC